MAGQVAAAAALPEAGFVPVRLEGPGRPPAWTVVAAAGAYDPRRRGRSVELAVFDARGTVVARPVVWVAAGGPKRVEVERGGDVLEIAVFVRRMLLAAPTGGGVFCPGGAP